MSDATTAAVERARSMRLDRTDTASAVIRIIQDAALVKIDHEIADGVREVDARFDRVARDLRAEAAAASRETARTEPVQIKQRFLLPEGFIEAIRDFAVTARAARRELADEYLLFCPRVLPVIGVASVHFQPSDAAEPLDLELAVMDDDRAVLPATVTEVHSTHLGRGRRAAVVVGSSVDGLVAGRFNYAFEVNGCVVAVSAAADRIPDAGFMLPFVDRLDDGIQVVAA